MEKVWVKSSGLSCEVDEVPWQSYGMNWSTRGSGGEAQGKQQVVEFLLEKQVEISRVEGWVRGTSKEIEENEVGGHTGVNSWQCRGSEHRRCQRKRKEQIIQPSII